MTVLRFGIPSLDRLIDSGGSTRGGISVKGNQTTSISIIGPDGTGKSVLGLHLASYYLFDQSSHNALPTVLYVSTDLSHSMAHDRTWKPFALDQPANRTIPFDDTKRAVGQAEKLNIDLIPLRPFGHESKDDGSQTVSAFINRTPVESRQLSIGFIDLAANSAGDDWSFINRLLSLLPKPQHDSPAHLMILDAVEGFETLVGDLDAYGQISTRRARIAQIMRSANKRCHLVFVAEEPTEERRIPEQFVTDLVLKLRKTASGGYMRRTLEIEKARGLEHVRGMQQYVIRSGRGSTTGDRQNLDDPKIELIRSDGTYLQSYFHVFPSLHYYARATMQHAGRQRPPKPVSKFAAFGIRYLDNMLDGATEQEVDFEDGYETSGLPCASVTALIGDSLTQKTRLGRAFLSRCFAEYPNRLIGLAEACKGGLPQIQYYLEALRPRPDSIDAALAAARDLIDKFRITQRRRLLLASKLLALANANSTDGPAILFTTYDVDTATLVKDFCHWLLREATFDLKYPDLRRVFINYCSGRTICRRLEIHDLSSAILMHIIQRAIRKAQSIVLNGRPIPQEADERFGLSHHVRVVIDDYSAVLAAYPEVRNDSLFLPALLFHLRREGVTSLIIDTHTGQPEMSHINAFDSELRAQVDQRLYTWHVPFFGENRVAIAPIPALTVATVRELRTPGTGSDKGDNLDVDPEFELYTGLEERRPRPVPLEIHVHEETPAYKAYMEGEDLFYRNLFAPNTGLTESTRNIIFCGSGSEYDGLQNFCYLDNDVRFDHTQIFEVDEFWAIQPPNALADMGPYLREITTESFVRSKQSDPFGLFQPTLASGVMKPNVNGEAGTSSLERYRSFPQYFGLQKTPDGTVDRVPFCWDFGFLVCRKRSWELAANEFPEVKRIWDALRKVTDRKTADRGNSLVPRDRDAESVSWRDFLNACRTVAEAETARSAMAVPAFDLSLLSPESFSCMVLELWASEIAKNKPQIEIDQRQWNGVPRKSGLIDWLDEGDGFERLYQTWKRGESNCKFKGYWIELYKTWLMLGETLDLSNLADPSNSFEFIRREPNKSAVATRQWYKTASAQTSLYSVTDPFVLTQLPGKYSVRGDWFLAVSRNSRSMRLAHRAIDILSSRRANINRLKMGVGLPVRDIKPMEIDNTLVAIKPSEMYEGPRTCLFKPGPKGERHTISYADLVYIGADLSSSPIRWMWRSSLSDYDRHSRIFHQWLCRMMIRLQQIKLAAGRAWEDGFKVIDEISILQDSPEKRREFFRTEDGMWSRLGSMDEFVKRLKFLVTDLKQASLIGKNSHPDREDEDADL